MVGSELSEEQIAALEQMTNRSALGCVVGVAGTGKSTILDVARQAWEAQGLQVYGAALAGKAADGLQAASGISSRTLAALEKSWDHGYEPIPSGSVLVVDEVGMVGTRQLNRVMSQLAERNCKVVLVGDPEQLQPIQAGTPFRDLLALHGHAKMQDVRRQRESWQREASVSLSKGHTEEAMAAYEIRGHVNTATSHDDAVASLVQDYLADMIRSPASKSRLALAHRRKDVFAINQGIRAELLARDVLKTEIMVDTDHGPRAFAAGDRVMFTRNDRTLGVKNGMLGTITDVSHTALRIAPDDGGRDIFVDANDYCSIEHGYAVSIHKSQGCTVDHTFILGTKTLDEHLTYVAMTRHKETATMYHGPERRRHEQKFSSLGQRKQRTGLSR